MKMVWGRGEIKEESFTLEDGSVKLSRNVRN
jgi:hypothetical protein